ncbi:retrovirus-related pol polyprotein from transposon TNT 1-94 [Tanacetum coccineum]
MSPQKPRGCVHLALLVDARWEEDDGVVRKVADGNTNEPNHVKPATKVGDDHLGITSLDKEGEVNVKNGVPGSPNTDLHDTTVAVDETLTRFRELHLVLTMNPSKVIEIDVENYELLLLGFSSCLEFQIFECDVVVINGIVSAYKSKKKISKVKEVKGFKGQSGNNNKRFNANSEVNQSVPGTSGSISSSFTNEQMMKLLSLINEKPTPAANMTIDSEANQHMTDSTKDMFNVVDVSSLMLIVGHPNGTLAKIFAIGSLRLTSGVVLFDVLVVPEYSVSLLSVNKMIKDSKFFVGFDEHKCYIQDLNLCKLVGTGSESGGLYLFDLDKIVLSILGKKLGFSKKGYMSPCDICHKAKQTREPFPLSDHKSKSVGDIIHCDVWGPYRVVSKDGFKNFLTLVDDFSRAVWVYLLKSKTKVGEYIESFIKLIFTQFGKKIKIVRSDNGTEFVNNHLSKMFSDLGIVYQTSCAYTPQQNGIAERKHRHLFNVARSLMFQGGIPLSMWPECVLTDVYLINRLPSSVLSGVSPYFLVYGKDPGLSHVRSFGCLCYSTILNNNDKFGVRSEKGGTSNVEGNSRMTSDDCFTVEDEVASVATQIEDNVTSEGNIHMNQNGKGQSNTMGTSPELRRSTRQRVMPARFNDFVVNSSVRYAMNLEMEALLRNNTYILADLPPGRKAIGCKWIWKIKYKSSGEIDRYKARLVAKGFGQREGIDYEETFSPVVKMVTVMCLIALAVQNSWPLFQIDVNNAFLYGDLKEEVYMELPPSKNDIFIAILVYVDDIVVTGIEVLENKNGMCLSQRKYCLELLSEYGLLACKPAATPLHQNVVLGYEESQSDKFLSNMSEYQKIVGKLIYLSITRPDISYVVHCLSQHMHASLQSHFSDALRVLRKSVSGFCFYLCNNLVSWKSKKQATISRSSAESEYRCLASTTCEVIWVIKILKDLGVKGLLPAHLYYDSISAISIAGNPVFHEKTKHFEIDLHLVREKVGNGVVKVLKVASANNVADIFTKGLSIAQHNEFCKKLKLVDMFKP